MEEQPQQLATRPNKTQLKRELAARSQLIEQMTTLSDAEMQRLGMEDDDIAQVAQVRALKPSGARNRQLKYCVKQLADVDLSTVETYLNDRHSQQLQLNQALHRLEQWRDRLLQQGDALLGEAMAEWPELDRQRFRQLVRDAQREHSDGKPAGAKRKLFRYLRDLSEQAPQ